MELYILDPATFLKDKIIDKFTSLIWTERFARSGDVTVVIHPKHPMANYLKEGTFVTVNGTREVAIISTVLYEEGMLKITGKTLSQAFAEAIFRTTKTHQDQTTNMTGTPGNIMQQIVQLTSMPDSIITGQSDFFEIGGPGQVIPHLILGEIDNTGASVTVAVPFGSAYDALISIADQFGLGFKMYLDSAVVGGYLLKFTAYRGVDRSDQGQATSVVFSPKMDSLKNVQELYSYEGYKNFVRAYAPSAGPGRNFSPGMAGNPNVVGFDRRAMMITVSEGIGEDTTDDNARIILNKAAEDALANNNYTRIVAGEVGVQTQYKYGTHYKLGDIVRLSGSATYRWLLTQKARITEYTRIHEAGGEKAYPTVSIVD